MKKITFIAALALGFAINATAQNNIHTSVIGAVKDSSGAITIVDPSTTIAVDITVKSDQTIVGPYARYTQKYLGVRSSLVEKTTYYIDNVTIALADESEAYRSGAILADNTAVQSHMGSDIEFAKILPDRISNSTLSLDDAAMEAAIAIFDIRKHRQELITGEAGENVFGGGLKDALAALDKQEQALLELFFGKHIISTHTERYYINVDAGNQSYTLAHFAKNTGLESTKAASGEAVTLNINPVGEIKTSSLTAADPRDKTTIAIRVAADCDCSVMVGDETFASRTLPVFEFGKTIHIAGGSAK